MFINADWGSADDAAIWRHAKEQGFTIVSKDSDFQDRSVLHGHPPKLIWLRAANCKQRRNRKSAACSTTDGQAVHRRG